MAKINSVELVKQLEELHNEENLKSCMHCWKPLSENYCKSCETTSNIESDPFLNVDLIVE